MKFSEPVFSTAFGKGELSFADFILSMAGGTASLPSPFPDGITKVSDSTFALGIKTVGIQSGYELLTVLPSPDAVYDATGNVANFFSQSNNFAKLNDKQLPLRPTGIAALPGDRKVTLGWINSPDADVAKSSTTDGEGNNGSNIYVLDTDYIEMAIAQPTQYIENRDYFAANQLVIRGLLYTMGELRCRNFFVQAKITDLSA